MKVFLNFIYKLFSFIWTKMTSSRNSGSICRCTSGQPTSDVRGLRNCGLSCCVNTLLQTFSVTTELQELLDRWQPSESREATVRNVPLQLRTALGAMRDQRHPEPHLAFLNCLHHHNIHLYTEHDADEVFLAILNLIEQQIDDKALAADIKNLYKIKVEGCIQCLECKNEHSVPSFFISLPLHISEEENHLMDCFQSFFKFQELEESESFYCDFCERKTRTGQGFKVVSLPNILCLHLKRFRSERGFTHKLDNKVTFPEVINFLPSEVANNIVYRLFGVVVHTGYTICGHYTAFICSTDHKWYHANDSSVTEVSWADVQTSYGEKRSGPTAYMLLYRRINAAQLMMDLASE